MGKKVKKKKPIQHLTYNKKEFLAPDSIRSMSVIHTKIKECGEASVVISDCRNSIKIWNDTNNFEEVKELVEKTNTIINSLNSFRNELMNRHGVHNFFSLRVSEPVIVGNSKYGNE